MSHRAVPGSAMNPDVCHEAVTCVPQGPGWNFCLSRCPLKQPVAWSQGPASGWRVGCWLIRTAFTSHNPKSWLGSAQRSKLIKCDPRSTALQDIKQVSAGNTKIITSDWCRAALSHPPVFFPNIGFNHIKPAFSRHGMLEESWLFTRCHIATSLFESSLFSEHTETVMETVRACLGGTDYTYEVLLTHHGLLWQERLSYKCIYCSLSQLCELYIYVYSSGIGTQPEQEKYEGWFGGLLNTISLWCWFVPSGTRWRKIPCVLVSI